MHIVLGVSIALVVVACTITQKHAPGVSIHETFVEIYPGTKISGDDQKALNAVLKHFDKSLYKIKTYDSGKLVKTRGGLADARIDQKLFAEISKASQNGFSDITIQILGALTSPSKNPLPPPPPPSTKEFLEIKQILQKYSQ